MSKRSGILTLSSAENYGAVLQCHSLCKFLNDNFSETEIIDFVPQFIVGRYPLVSVDKSSKSAYLKSLIRAVLLLPFKAKKRWRFQNFRKKKSKYSVQRYIGKMTSDSYDQYIVGSDQVFNMELTNYDQEYFLPRIPTGKKTTYAASLGVSYLNERQSDCFTKGLQSFDPISIREKTGKDLIQDLFVDKNIEQMIDPVFLNSREYWTSLASKRMHSRKYILIYAFVEFDKAYSIAKSIDETLDILLINDAFKKKKNDVKNVMGVGPCEFLSLILNAEHIVTDSFHGTAFSIIFNKDFYAIPYKGTESRFIDMLSILKLEDRIIEDVRDIKKRVVDYNEVRELIHKEQERANNYFKRVYS